jgi:hypothetical protein
LVTGLVDDIGGSMMVIIMVMVMVMVRAIDGVIVLMMVVTMI